MKKCKGKMWSKKWWRTGNKDRNKWRNKVKGINTCKLNSSKTYNALKHHRSLSQLDCICHLGELSVGIIDWSDDEVPITGVFLWQSSQKSGECCQLLDEPFQIYFLWPQHPIMPEWEQYLSYVIMENLFLTWSPPHQNSLWSQRVKKAQIWKWSLLI